LKDTGSQSIVLNDNEESLLDIDYSPIDPNPHLNSFRPQDNTKLRIPGSLSQLNPIEIPPFQRKRNEISLSKERLPEVNTSREPKIESSVVDKPTTLSLTYLPSIKVNSPLSKRPFVVTDRPGLATQTRSHLSSPRVKELGTGKVEQSSQILSAGRIANPRNSTSADPKTAKTPLLESPSKRTENDNEKGITGAPDNLLISARERMIKKIQRFLPENPSIEERMVESSKRSFQEPEVKRLSQLGQTSGSNENSSLRNQDRTDNMNFTKVSEGNPSQLANPGLQDPAKTLNEGNNSMRVRKNKNTDTLVKNFASPEPHGTLFPKTKLGQARRSEGPLTSRATIKTFQESQVARKGSPSLTILGKSGLQMSSFSPKMADFFLRPEQESQSKDTPPDSSKQGQSESRQADSKPQKGSSDELDLFSRRSEADRSGHSDPRAREMIDKDSRGDLLKPGGHASRPDWKSDNGSELRFITYSDD
jgi:hypothetical protein